FRCTTVRSPAHTRQANEWTSRRATGARGCARFTTRSRGRRSSARRPRASSTACLLRSRRADRGSVAEAAARHRIASVGGGVLSRDRKSTRLNSSHVSISYAVFCLKKKKKKQNCVAI